MCGEEEKMAAFKIYSKEDDGHGYFLSVNGPEVLQQAVEIVKANPSARPDLALKRVVRALVDVIEAGLRVTDADLKEDVPV
ncbi:MAG: hypothetical protein A2Y63_02560 [Candidatus Riflebacteria bacterium RBG_13_59_9]|nr:MAG: hypothetical protein A2Y63_02560 [Candidatus Riflebacteria bacterium RBG_13_59_9]